MENDSFTEEEQDLFSRVKEEFASTVTDILSKQNEIVDDAIGQLIRKGYKLGSLVVATCDDGLVQTVHHDSEKLFESRIFVSEVAEDDDIQIEITGTWFGKEREHA